MMQLSCVVYQGPRHCNGPMPLGLSRANPQPFFVLPIAIFNELRYIYVSG